MNPPNCPKPRIKVTQPVLGHLEEILDEQNDDLRPSTLTINHLQAVLDLQGYYRGVRYRYYPVTDSTGLFLYWRSQERVFGA